MLKSYCSFWIKLRTCIVFYLCYTSCLWCLMLNFHAVNWMSTIWNKIISQNSWTLQHFKDSWTLLEFMLKILSWSINNECKYGQVITISRSHHRVCADDAVVQWWKRDGTIVRWRRCKDKTTRVQWYDVDKAILYCTIFIA